MNKDLKLIINLHRSPLLADAVAALNPNWKRVCEYSKENMPHGEDRAIRVDGDRSDWNDWKGYNFGSLSRYMSEGYVYLDAATEFGKLVALLEKPESKVIKHLTKDYAGVVSEDGSGITVGCSFVPREKVKEAYEALFECKELTGILYGRREDIRRYISGGETADQIASRYSKLELAALLRELV